MSKKSRGLGKLDVTPTNNVVVVHFQTLNPKSGVKKPKCRGEMEKNKDGKKRGNNEGGLEGEKKNLHIRRSVEHASRENKPTRNRLLPDLLIGEINATKVGIVGAVYEDEVHASHAQEDGNKSQGGNLVFPEELLCADEPTKDTDDDHNGAEDGDPPADQECGLVIVGATQGRWTGV